MHAIKTPIYQTAQIREIENLAVERFDLSGSVLMQRAGKAAFDFLQRRWPQAQKIVVFCGSGNNGGDGYVFARLAHDRGLKVVIWQIGDPSKSTEETRQARERCREANIQMNMFDEKADLSNPDVIVDAICGIGVHDNLREEVVSAIKKMERVPAPVFSIDIPSGVDADTGRMLGASVHATATITFIGLKLGLLTGQGIAYAGEVVVNDLQLPTELFSFVEPIAEKIHLSSYSNYLKPRLRDWHKGLSGHVLVVGGEEGYCGAPRMAAQAALRVGAGLVSVATKPEHAAFMSVTCPEIMGHGVTKPEQLGPLVERADVIVLGPGLGQTAWSKKMWEYICKLDLPLVVDADALNLLAQHHSGLVKENWVLTPHPGEASRLIDEIATDVQHDRLVAAKEINKCYGGVCVLKGAGSIVITPNSLPALCDKGNPGMASAGMGDVLSGVIAGLIAQGIPLSDAAKMGVCIHAMAGDLAVKDGERGLLATDLMPYLRRLSNQSVTG